MRPIFSFRRLIDFSLTVLSLVICAQAYAGNTSTLPDNQTTKTPTEIKKCPDLNAEHNTNLDIVREILNDRKPYAALAFIESYDFQSPRLDLLKAQSLRQIGSFKDAEVIYQRLTTSCVAGHAYQGLGQISNHLGDHSASASYLRIAANIMPIDSTVRGDYGVALMQLGRFDEARREFLTAIELDSRNTRARNNLIYLLYITNEGKKAEMLAKQHGMNTTELEEIKANALSGQARDHLDN